MAALWRIRPSTHSRNLGAGSARQVVSFASGRITSKATRQLGSRPSPKLHSYDYWMELAHNERCAARDDRISRFGTVESMRVHDKNADLYEQNARDADPARYAMESKRAI